MGRFRIKIRGCWFSKDFTEVRYSTNGLFWKGVKECKYDTINQSYRMETKIIHFSDVEEFMNQIDTIEKVNKYESEQRDNVIKYNKKIIEEEINNEKKRRYVYKQHS